MTKAVRLFSIAAAFLAFAAGPANATVIIDVTEVGGDVVFAPTEGNAGMDEQFGVPAGYISGAIASGMVLSEATIEGFTLIPGTYDFIRPNDTIRFNIRQAAVPEPATLALLGLGLAGLGFARRKKA